MTSLYEFIAESWSVGMNAGWAWFFALNRDEWLVVLVVGCLMGFLCMRGLSSRNHL